MQFPAEEPASVPPPVVEGLPQPPDNLVVLWNEAMLAAVRNGPPRPTVIARSLYMVHAAMFDAWAMYDGTAVPTTLDPTLRRPAAEHSDAYKGAAVSQAAYQMLLALFPDYEKNSYAFSNLLNELGYTIVSKADPASPEGIGYLAAQAVLVDRANDSANAANNYAEVVSQTFPELYVVQNSADPNAENAPGHAGFNPNHWQPLRVPTGVQKDVAGWPMVDQANPDTFKDQAFLTPHWGAVRPFALSSGNQFRPHMPPQAGSTEPYTDALGQTMSNDEAYNQQVDEILNLSANLTDEQKVIAEYWADGPRSETPPGHWNALAHGISFRDGHTIDEDIKMYFALNGALFDGSIAAWEAKRFYDYVRPASAIQHKYAGQLVEAWGGPDQGTQLIPGETWRPYQSLTFVTPPFAEYVSGHSTFSAAAAEVLTRFTGSNQFYDGVTVLYDEDYNRDGIPDMLGQHVTPIRGNMFEGSPADVVTLQWSTFQEAADEAGISRRYGGIHFQDADLFARQMGTQIGAQAYSLAEKYWQGQVLRPSN
ncbi:MAG: vanadium-dependent haloperoxidase [Anaerolineae bacterium]|nr:vanadium-dependent haloperoxidase [Anaerolineae bacterium]